MAKREYVEANKRWLEEKAREEGVQALPRYGTLYGMDHQRQEV